MKTITLKKLTLQNWRAQNKVVEFTNNTEITGRNESGKSSIFNAFLWVLMNCDSEDRVNYKLFDEKEEQTYENSKTASVEAVIEIDGVTYSLRKTAKAGWIRKKGREIYEKKSTDEYHFYIDQIERNATEYKSFIEEIIAPFSKLKLMLNINYYLGMDWKDLRRTFEDLVGTIKEEDFKGDYSIIKNELAKYTPEQIKESIKGQIKPIKKSIESMPITIETLKSSLPKIEDLDEVQQEIDDAKSQIEMIDKQLLGSSESVQKFIDKRNEELAKIGELESEYNKCKIEHEANYRNERSNINGEIGKIAFINNEISRENEKNKQTIDNAKESLKLATSKLGKLNDYRQQLLAEYCLPFLKRGGYFLAYKGPDSGEEVRQAEKAIFLLGGRCLRIEEVPVEDFNHNIIVMEKIKSTPAKFPRKAGTPAKEPIF